MKLNDRNFKGNEKLKELAQWRGGERKRNEQDSQTAALDWGSWTGEMMDTINFRNAVGQTL